MHQLYILLVINLRNGEKGTLIGKAKIYSIFIVIPNHAEILFRVILTSLNNIRIITGIILIQESNITESCVYVMK